MITYATRSSHNQSRARDMVTNTRPHLLPRRNSRSSPLTTYCQYLISTMSIPELSSGVILRLSNPEDKSEELLNSKPVLQILSVKKVGPAPGPGNSDRYRIIVSDGEHFLQAMLATQLNNIIEEAQFGKNAIIRITQFTCNMVQEKR